MAALCRLVAKIGKNFVFPEHNRAISLSATTHWKEIIEKKEGNDLIIEAVIHPEKDSHLLFKRTNGACSLCSAGVDVKHTDVLILQQFLRSDGCMLPRRITGLCKVQHKRVGIMVSMAQKAGLMPSIAPADSKKDPSKRRDWKKYHTYYDESTIRYRYL